VAYVPTPAGSVTYAGNAQIDGVPGAAAGIAIDFLDVAGSSCGSLLPTGSVVDRIDGIDVTCIDNGMPVVIMAAADLGKTGDELPQALEADPELKRRVEALRRELGPRMNLGNVEKKTVPKMTLVSPGRCGGAISTRTFIPHRVHEAIGVLGAVSVATAILVPGSVAARIAGRSAGRGLQSLDIEHPTGFFTVDVDVTTDGSTISVRRAALLRTARLLMRGEVFVPAATWQRDGVSHADH
jgi:4-oxalomesaconate tautomerase